MMNLTDGINKFTENDVFPFSFIFDGFEIEQIYSGKDHYCRCGCGGKYYDDMSSRTAKIILTRAEKAFKKYYYECEMFIGKDYKNCWLNIPTNFEGPGRCYCIYFHKKEK